MADPKPIYLPSIDIYQSPNLIHLVGSNPNLPNSHHVITFDRNNPSTNLKDLLFAHPRPLDRRELGRLLRSRPSLDELRRGFDLQRNTASFISSDPRSNEREELSLVGHGVCLLGVVRFLKGFYLVIVTDSRRVGYINGHTIYGITHYRLHQIYSPLHRYDPNNTVNPQISAKTWFGLGTSEDPIEKIEDRYRVCFQLVDLTKDFFFSYTYDLTNTAQTNYLQYQPEIADEFMWNMYLVSDLVDCLPIKNLVKNPWVVPLIHGSFGQQRCSLFGAVWTLTLLGRRSRYYAGTRYLKRGVNEHGHVANHVEVEQIVESDCVITAFCQVRGSIPLFWSQETSATIPKPPIKRYHYDSTFRATREHFRQLIQRHGNPIIVLNLVRQSERVPKESLLGEDYRDAVEFLNFGLERKNHIVYEALDFKRASKSGEALVLKMLDKIAERGLNRIEIFSSTGSTQKGTFRVNCIDGLDRTNVGQFCVGLCALGRMFACAGGVSGVEPSLDKGGTFVRLFMELFEHLGDDIAQQYGGSLAHKKGGVLPGNPLMSKQRELLTSMRRYYNNSFTDADKQGSINLFLGKFVPKIGEEHLWDVKNDFYMHNELVTTANFTLDVDPGVGPWSISSGTELGALFPSSSSREIHSPLQEQQSSSLVVFDDVLNDAFFRPVQIVNETEINESPVLSSLSVMKNSINESDEDAAAALANEEVSSQFSGGGVGGSGKIVDNLALPTTTLLQVVDLQELECLPNGDFFAKFCEMSKPSSVFATTPDPSLREFLADFCVQPDNVNSVQMVMKKLGPVFNKVEDGEWSGLTTNQELADLYQGPWAADVMDWPGKAHTEKQTACMRLQKEREVFEGIL